ncbi:MAG: cation:proton antiporter [Ilumatobacteraceae bacterium]|nr:cation:proton antiporter [Ilumatobacteraceae bacterium]
MIAAENIDAAVAFVEIGALVLLLAILARLAGRFGITAIPLYLIAGLAVGEGGFAKINVSEDFISIGAEIGVLLLLLALGLQYSQDELQTGLRTGMQASVVNFVLNALPGFAFGLLLGWEPLAAVLLGGITWATSAGIVSKVLADLGRLGNRETPPVLNMLVVEDLSMAIYLPIVAALIVGGSLLATSINVAIALGLVTIILLSALRYGQHFSALLVGGSDEALLLSIFATTLLVAGIAQQLDVSGAIGAFLVGLAVSGPAARRAAALISPLRDLFAATFFLFFSFQIDPADLTGAIVPAVILAIIGIGTKFATGWYTASRAGVGQAGRARAGVLIIPRGEFSIVIAALGSELVDGPELGALAATYVLITAIVGPLATKFSDRIPLPSGMRRRAATTASAS